MQPEHFWHFAQSAKNVRCTLAAGDEVVLLKTVLSNFRPKQAKEWIGDQTATLFRLFNALLSWPNLTCVNRPLSPFFYHPTPPGFPLFCWFFSELKINSHKKEGGQIIELFIAYLTWPILTCWSKHLNSFFHRLTPPVGEPLWKFKRTDFQ
jgi:hypothetical protein